MKKRGIWVSQYLFFILFASIGAFGNFINLYLEQVVGLTGSQIGLIMFIGLITTMFMNPVWGFLADKLDSHELILKITFFLTAVTAALFMNASTFLSILLCIILFETMRAPILPLLEFLSTEYSERYGYDYGKIRVFASLGWLTMTVVTGFMVAGLSANIFGLRIGFEGFVSLRFATFGFMIIFMILQFIFGFFLPNKPEKENKEQKTKRFGRNEVFALFKNKSFVFILCLTMIGFMAQESAFGFATMHMVSTLHASEAIISWNALVMVTPELVLVPLGTILMVKTGFKNWYFITHITMIIRLLFYGFATSPFVFVAGGVFHALMVVMHTTGTILFIRKVVPAESLGLSFTILASSMALSRGVLSLLFGVLYDHVSSFAVFRVAIIFVIVALVMVIKSKSLKEVGKSWTVN